MQKRSSIAEEQRKQGAGSLLRFTQSAADMERRLVGELEDFLNSGKKEGLSALHEGDSPKLGLLLNCFGAGEEAILALKDLTSADLLGTSPDDLKEIIGHLPRDQRNVVQYTQEMLDRVKDPFLEHDCAICDCETAEEIAAFSNERGVLQVTAELIKRTGAFGRGSLLFLTAQELGFDKAHRTILNEARIEHRKR